MLMKSTQMLLALACLLSFSKSLAVCEDDERSDKELLSKLLAPIEMPDGTNPPYAKQRDVYMERFRSLWCDYAFESEGLAEASDEAVDIRLRSAAHAVRAIPSDWTLSRFRAALDEADARGLAKPSQYHNLFNGYLAASNQKAAQTFRKAYPEVGLPEVPDLVKPTDVPDLPARLVWGVDGKSAQLKGMWTEVNRPQLLIVTTPNCGFCKIAAEQLTAHRMLGPLVQEHALWLSKQSVSDTFWKLADWNQKFPGATTYFVDDPDDWPYIDFSITPQFYFVEDDEVRKTMAGFQGGEEALKQIAEGFVTLGLMDPDVFSDVFTNAD